MEKREGESGEALSFGEFTRRDKKLGQPRYNNFKMRLIMEDNLFKDMEQGEGDEEEGAGRFFCKLKKEHSGLVDSLLEKIRKYHKIPREKLEEQEATDLLSEIELALHEIYKIMKGYGADEYNDLSFSPSE